MKTAKFGRKFYYPAVSGIVKHENRDGGIEIFISATRRENVYTVVAFAGKRSKPDIYANYRGIDAANKAIENWLNNLKRVADCNAEHKAKMAAAKKNVSVEVGDIFVASWGYEQTNVDAYQVVEVVSQSTIKVRKIATRGIPGTQGMDCQNVVAVPNHFVSDEVLTKRVSASGYNSQASVKIDSCRTAHSEGKTPKSHYCSWYY